jgi:PAB-dependent poly(A)-specific ribonuclease subunit 3
MSDNLREDLQKRSEVMRSIPTGMNVGLPDDLQGYHSLVALEFTPHNQERRRFGNWFSTVYKAVSEKDGVTYVLRRIEGQSILSRE